MKLKALINRCVMPFTCAAEPAFNGKETYLRTRFYDFYYLGFSQHKSHMKYN